MAVFTIDLATEIFDAGAAGVVGGDIIEVLAGVRSRLHITNLLGDDGNPVIIRNSGGLVDIQGAGGGASNVPFALNGSQYVKIDGSGDPAVTYGFKVFGESHAQIEFQGRASNMEIAWCEVSSGGDTGFAGIMIKTDPNSNYDHVRPNDPNAAGNDFTLYDIKIHDCWIHDCQILNQGGEGIYIGNSFWRGWTRNMPAGETAYPHNIFGCRIYNNIIERCGRECIQAGAVVSGLEIHDNILRDWGLNTGNGNSQRNGIQLGEGSTGKVYNNLMEGNDPDIGIGAAILTLGLGDYDIFNNIINGVSGVANDGEAIIQNMKGAAIAGDPGFNTGGFLGGARVINNTIIDYRGAGVYSNYLNDAPGNLLHNNISVSDKVDYDTTTGDWTKSNNLHRTEVNVGQIGFLDYANNDFHIQQTSPAVDAGLDVSAYGITFDKDNADRPFNAIWDIGAYEYGATVSGAGQLVVIGQPSNTVDKGVISPPIKVEIRDANGDIVPSANDAVTLALNSDPEGASVISGTLTKNAVNGVATFDDISIDSK